MDNLKEFLNKEKISYRENFLLKYETCFKTGGVAKFFLLPRNKEEVIKIFFHLSLYKIPYKLIGATSNILFYDGDSYQVLISTSLLKDVFKNGDLYYFSAGYSMPDLSRVALLNCATGFEGLEGIPGSIGGGIFMNASAYGYSISDNLVRVECFSPEKGVFWMEKDECLFDYRHSYWKENKETIIIGAYFSFPKGVQSEIRRRMEVFHIARHSYQDFTFPNLGSLLSIGKENIYKEIFKGDCYFYAMFIFLHLILNNPFSKFLRRKRPNSELLNILFIKFLRKNSIDIETMISNKSINILVNDGKFKGDSYEYYMKMLYDLSGNKFTVENEIVRSF